MPNHLMKLVMSVIDDGRLLWGLALSFNFCDFEDLSPRPVPQFKTIFQALIVIKLRALVERPLVDLVPLQTSFLSGHLPEACINRLVQTVKHHF